MPPKTYTEDWHKVGYFDYIKENYKFPEKEIKILEIGSFEGRSACWFMDNYPSATIDCVDIFDPEWFRERRPETKGDYDELFDLNTQEYGNRVNKIKSTSTKFFNKIDRTKPIYDLIYIDGNHSSRHVLEDAVNSYNMLKLEGILIFDDYLAFVRNKFPWAKPQLAIDSFIECYTNHVDVIFKDKVCAVKKVK